MCGIAGFLGEFDADLLERMAAMLAHRGPDDSGIWFDREASVGLAHTRLSIIDLRPEGHQPMSNENDTIWVSYNGEVYNYQQLRETLIQKGHAFKSNSDTEVLVHLYEEYGPDMLSHLNGMFAFALWDGGRRELFVARDGFGIKPLYYAELDCGFVFASEMKALLSEPRLPRDVDFEALHYYLAFLWCPAPHTMLRAVRKLEPGEAMLVRDGRIVRRWTHSDLDYDGQYSRADADTLASELRERLNNAVMRQLVSDVPVGAFLSGGLDSSAIVAMAAGGGRRLPCYSIGFDGEDLDGSPSDLPFARQVARHVGVELHEIRIDPSVISHLEQIIWHLDEPQADPAPINVMLIAEQARRDGIKVLLSGAGGDDIFSGYRRHLALTLEAYWSWLPKSMRGALPTMATILGSRNPHVRRLAKVMSNADRSSDGRICGYFEWSTESVRRGLYSHGVAGEVAAIETEAPLMRSLARIPSETNRLNRMLYLDTRHFLADHNLSYTDKASMAVGVEVRVPYLDPDLVAFATSIPPAWKQRGRIGKAIFKRAMEPLLPHDVIYRPKTGFGAPLRRWLRRELREMVADVLSPSAVARRGWFVPEQVSALIAENDAGKADNTYLIFSLLCVEIWCRLFIDGQRDQMSAGATRSVRRV